jgi:hypothetical protein
MTASAGPEHEGVREVRVPWLEPLGGCLDQLTHAVPYRDAGDPHGADGPVHLLRRDVDRHAAVEAASIACGRCGAK